MTMELHQIMRERRRRAMLDFLKECPGYASNVPIIADVVHSVGIKSTPDLIEESAAWMARKGLIEIVGEGREIKLTATGLQVALGRQSVEGVRMPDID